MGQLSAESRRDEHGEHRLQCGAQSGGLRSVGHALRSRHADRGGRSWERGVPRSAQDQVVVPALVQVNAPSPLLCGRRLPYVGSPAQLHSQKAKSR